jgi:hypothetical protein
MTPIHPFLILCAIADCIIQKGLRGHCTRGEGSPGFLVYSILEATPAPNMFVHEHLHLGRHVGLVGKIHESARGARLLQCIDYQPKGWWASCTVG